MSRAGRNGHQSIDRGAFESQRAALIGYLRARFRRALSEEDLEDIAQESWAAVLRKEAAGEPIGDVFAFMRSVAWRDARDLIRNRWHTAVDPSDRVFEDLEDLAPSPAQRLARQVDLARAIEAVEQLPAAQRAAYRARFVDELSTREACKRLGVPRSTYHHRLRRAIESVHATLDPTRFAELQTKLLGAYVAGVASLGERRRAERLIRSDPHAAAMARELRKAHEATAGAVAPVALERGAETGILEQLAGVPGHIRDAVAHATGRGSGVSDAASSPLATGGGTRGAGAAATGGLGTLAGLGTAGKAVIGCLGAGAAATACVATGLVPVQLPGGGHPERGGERATKVSRVTEQDQLPALLPGQVANEPTDTPSEPVSPPPPEPEPPAPEPAPAPVAPSAPPVQQEFSVASAAAPVGGGGGGGGSGGGGSAVQREFGP